jgi:hypothetical protein
MRSKVNHSKIKSDHNDIIWSKTIFIVKYILENLRTYSKLYLVKVYYGSKIYDFRPIK